MVFEDRLTMVSRADGFCLNDFLSGSQVQTSKNHIQNRADNG
jgi:hypothetical protein